MKNILVLTLVFLSFLSANAKGSKSPINEDQLYTQMALLSLDCVHYGDSLPKEKILEIKKVLKEGRKIQSHDSVGTYFTSLIELSYLHFSKRDSKKAYNRANHLISKYATFETTSFGTKNHNRPTWGWISERNGVNLGKIKFSLVTSFDHTKYGEHNFLKTVLQEIPMTLDEEIYKDFIACYQYYGASDYDLMYFILRCIKYNKCNLANSLLKGIFENDTNELRINIAKLGISLYANIYGREDMVSELCDELSYPYPLSFDNVDAQKAWSFCLTLFGSNLIENRQVFLPIISNVFGENSSEYLWASSRDISLFESLTQAKNEIDWSGKISSAQLIGDSIALSTNILKSMAHEEEKYRYDSMLHIGEMWGQSIIPSHLVEYWNGMGLAYSYLGLYKKAICCYNNALSILDSKLPQQPVFIMTKTKESVARNLAFTYCYQGEYDLAIKTISEDLPRWTISNLCIPFCEDILHLDDLGRVYSYTNVEKAKEFFEAADSLLVARGSLAMTWSNEINHYISWSSITINKNAKRKYINRAEQVLNTNLSSELMSDPMAAGAIYSSLGRFYYSIFDYKTASENYRKAYQSFSPLKLEDRRKTELTLWNCLNRIAMRDTDGIQAILESQLAMQDSLLGPNHYDCHQTVKGLLKLAITERNQKLARQYFSRFKSMEGVFGREQLNYGNQLIESSILSLLGNHREAYEVADLVDLAECEPSVGLQALEVKQSLTMNLPTRIQTYELQSINNSAKVLSARLFTEVSGQDRVEWARQLGNLRSGFIVNARTQEQIDNALDFSLFTKGLLFRTNKYIVGQIGKTRQGQTSLKELSIMNDSINHSIALGDSIKSFEFQRRYEDKERDLVNQFLTPEIMLTGLQIGKSDAVKNIGKDGLGIDFVKYTLDDSSYYGAFVFAENLPTKFLPLFTEDDLLRLVTDDSGRRSYEAFDGKHSSGALCELIWGKLIPFFEGRSDVYFSGDGEISKLGIEYLTDPKGISIGSSVRIHRAFHLADVTSDVTGGKDIICMGVANHDFPVPQNGDDVDRGLWCNLNCDKEILDIRSVYKKKKGHQTFLIDDDVTEPFIQTLPNTPLSILHISTHGFYYNQDRLRSYARSTNSPDHYLAMRSLQSGKNSLSGLVLRKGNEYRKMPTLPMGYDDIWTSDEIEGLNFPKLQLTVLSACQTGLGDTDSEGVWGLQRAFRIAGTQKLVCALDYVSDKRTREFMNVFYKNLSKGITIYDSFQSARNHLFRHHRDDPRMWSAFVLIE